MNLGDQLFVYCERGLDPEFLAEPVNALSNAAFVLVGIVAFIMIQRHPVLERAVMHYLLAFLTVAIGIGSFLFHTYATIWAAIADVVPIGIFILVYFAIALRVFLRVPVAVACVLTLALALTLWAARQLRCGPDLLISMGGEGGRCLNGSVGYLPALLVLIMIGTVLAMRRKPPGRALLTAGCIFAVSLTFRTLDAELCHRTVIAGYSLGSHFLWHLLNALTLFILIRAAIVQPDKAGSITASYSSGRGLHADLRQENSARSPR